MAEKSDQQPRKVLPEEHHELQSAAAVMARALLDISGWPYPACESSTTGIGACYAPHSGRTESCPYTADRVCDACRAYRALQQSGALPS